MAFGRYIYESDSGVSFYIRMDTDQATEAGAVAGTPDIAAHVQVSGSGRRYGIQPRHIVATRLVGVAPDQYTKSTRMPVCTPAAFAALADNAAIVINGTNYTIARKVDEERR